MQESISAALPELNRQSVLERLSPLLAELNATKIPGSRLAPLIDSILPAGTTYRLFVQHRRPANLRAFVEDYLVGLVETTSEKSGTDPIYTICTTSSPVGEIRSHGMLWKSFVAVTPTRQLFFDKLTSELNVRESSTASSEQTPTVQSVTVAEFDLMRSQFLAALEQEGEVTSELKALLDGGDTVTYQTWVSMLKAATPRLDRRWQEFRRSAIVRLFESRLHGLAVQQERIEELKVQLLRDLEQTRTHKPVGEPAATADANSAMTAGEKISKEKHARDLLHTAIDRMTMEQMQSLNIPFSVVLELIKHVPQ